MTRNEFLRALELRLVGLPKVDREDRLSFYNEMIADRMDEGLSEEDAIAALGGVDSVVAQAIASTPLSHLVRERIGTRRRPTAWEITLIAVGAPIWLSLLISLFAVALSLFVSLWALVLCLWACELALAVSLLGGIGLGTVLAFTSSVPIALMTVGAGFAAGGLAIFFFFGAKYATIGMVRLTRLSAIGIKKLFI